MIDYRLSVIKELKEDSTLLDQVINELKMYGGSTPMIQELAAYKDNMGIADHQWHCMMETFKLGSYTNITAMRKQQAQENSYMPIELVGKTGYEISVHHLLEHHLKRNSADPSQPILVKFTLNGTNMTSGKHITQELGGLQILTPGESMASVKSPNNCQVFLIYIGGETDEELHQSLASTKEVHSHGHHTNHCHHTNSHNLHHHTKGHHHTDHHCHTAITSHHHHTTPAATTAPLATCCTLAN
jgi:hypothetical protein